MPTVDAQLAQNTPILVPFWGVVFLLGVVQPFLPNAQMRPQGGAEVLLTIPGKQLSTEYTAVRGKRVMAEMPEQDPEGVEHSLTFALEVLENTAALSKDFVSSFAAEMPRSASSCPLLAPTQRQLSRDHPPAPSLTRARLLVAPLTRPAAPPPNTAPPQ